MSNWEGLDEFLAVATTGSFTAAAGALKTSTSRVSRAVARLEEKLGIQLLFRTTRIVTLTDTGRAFAERCSRIVEDRDDALAMVEGGEVPKGSLRITCSTALGERYVAPIVRRFAEEFRELDVYIELTNRLLDIVAEGFDLAIRTGRLNDSSLIGMRIASRRQYLCASSDYVATKSLPQKIDDLALFDCLRGTAATWHFQENGQERRFTPRGRWRCNSGAATVDAMLAGMGICQLPEFYVMHHLSAGRAIELLPDFRPADEPVWAVCPSRRQLLPKVRLLVDRLRSELPEALGTAPTHRADP
jgi:DNA-binding transcriptional LysR family regulator